MSAAINAAVSEGEVARFDALAGQWWDADGPMRPLHRMNPLRIGWIDSRIRAAFGGPMRVLDAGCGGGLASEALARLGHRVTGLDAAPAAIEVARAHAAESGLRITYRLGLAQGLLAEGVRFPAIAALEVIEHVPDPDLFLHTLAGLLEPGGKLFISTLNRTRLSWITAILGAEYMLRMLPVGTHDWRRFLTPAELSAYLRRTGLRVDDLSGMVPDLTRGGWKASRRNDVNYIVMAG